MDRGSFQAVAANQGVQSLSYAWRYAANVPQIQQTHVNTTAFSSPNAERKRDGFKVSGRLGIPNPGQVLGALPQGYTGFLQEDTAHRVAAPPAKSQANRELG